ncbi:MAG: hypothetical protein HPY90_11730 [Syntrophothermus sp.]|uniref:hypothetical protein n=1 Tax=Syntrophothermus sp. TaxID=2736299 RepID=UPI0025798A81|nr:hypothetical protein [Syntrophothermus sp.]NSW83917.1 hypothetical protein [Syntrophothermus sp.]
MELAKRIEELESKLLQQKQIMQMLKKCINELEEETKTLDADLRWVGKRLTILEA